LKGPYSCRLLVPATRAGYRCRRAFGALRNATRPGRSPCSSKSNEARPPVDTNVIRPARPSLSSAATVSPPPTMLKARLDAMASATALVPSAKRGSSNAPRGPFQKTDFASPTSSAKVRAVRGPMSAPIHPTEGRDRRPTCHRCSPRRHRHGLSVTARPRRSAGSVGRGTSRAASCRHRRRNREGSSRPGALARRERRTPCRRPRAAGRPGAGAPRARPACPSPSPHRPARRTDVEDS
jgi:hypothetical protein